jgi:hypothetical protein
MKRLFLILISVFIALLVFSNDLATINVNLDLFQNEGGIETPNENNAYWQLKNDPDRASKVARCRKDTENTYSDNDNATLSNSNPIDLSAYNQATLYLYTKLEAADSGDYGEIYVNGDLIDTIDTNHEWTQNSYNLDSYCGTQITIEFVWKSDSSGVDKGWRLDDIQIIASGAGSPDWQQVLFWDEDHSPYSGEHVELNISDWASGVNPSSVNFHYNDDSEWAWFVEIDNVYIYDNTRSNLLATEEFEGSFPPSGWTVTENGDTDGIWRSNSYWERTNWTGGDGHCADADSDGYGGSSLLMDTELITPDINCSSSSTVTLEFDVAYNDIGSGDYFEILVWSSYYVDEVFFEEFDNLNNWDTEENGNSSIVQTSLGSIKTLFE